MRPVFKRSVAITLCGFLAFSGLALAAGPDRSVALERLRQAMPSVSQLLPIGGMIANGARTQLLTLNPGKEAQIKPIADRLGACTTEILDGPKIREALIAAIEAADFTEAELLKVAAFFEAPETNEMFIHLGKVMSGEIPPEKADSLRPEVTKQAEIYQSDLALIRFQQVFHNSGQDVVNGGTLQQGMALCVTEMNSAAAKAGLKAG